MRKAVALEIRRVWPDRAGDHRPSDVRPNSRPSRRTNSDDGEREPGGYPPPVLQRLARHDELEGDPSPYDRRYAAQAAAEDLEHSEHAHNGFSNCIYRTRLFRIFIYVP